MELLNFTDLIDVNELKLILTNIYNLTQIPLTLVDCNDVILFEIGVLQICTDFHVKNEEALKTCVKHKENQKDIIFEQPYKCDNNMLHIIVPIKSENIIIGNLIIGQFFYDNEEIDYKLYIEQAKKFNYDINGYINSLGKIPVFSKEHVDNIIELCVNIINQMIKTNLANSRLNSNEKLLRTLINSMPDIVCFKDGDGKWVEANDFDLNLFGLNGIDYKGKKDSELAKYSEFYKDAFLICEDSDEITWKSKKITRCEEIIPKPNGESYTFDVIKIPLFENNERKGLIVVGRDITEQKKAVSEMFEAEKQFKQLFESMVEGVAFHEIIYDKNNNAVNYKITNVNSSYEKILNIKKQDILNKTATEVYKLDSAPYLKEYNNVSENGENFQFETYFEGMDKYFHISVISFKKGTFVTIFFDVTEQRKAEQRIIELNKSLESKIIALTQPLDDLSDLRFEDIFNVSEIQKIQDAFSDATGVASLITKPNGIPLTKPSNFCGLCNLIRKTEKGLKNCLHSDAVIGNKTEENYIMQPCYSGGLWDGGTSIKVGNKHIANWLVGQVIDENIDETKILNYADEIEADKTEFKKELFKVTKMSKDKFEKICIALNLIANQLSYLAIQNIQQARFIMDRKKAEENLKENEETFRLFMDNLKAVVFIKDSDLRAKFTNKYFYELFGDYLIGRTPVELFPNNQEIALKMVQDDIDVMNGKVKMPIFEKVIDVNGNERYFETYKFRIPAKNGDMLGGIALEITEVKKIEEKLKESRESFFKLIDIIPNGIVIHKQGKIEYINNSALNIMEFSTTDNVIGKNVFSFVHPDYIEIVKKRVIGQKDTEVLIEEKFITAKNNIIDVEVSGKMFKYDGEFLNIVAFRDITERKKAEEALRESEEKFRLLAENTSDIISLTTTEGEFLYISPSVENILGYKQNEIIGTTSNQMVAEEDIEELNLWFKSLLENNSENKFTKFRMKHKNGTVYWFESLLNIIRDEKGFPAYILASTRNINEKVIAEEIIQNQIKELEAKNAEMERFTYTVSHDLKSPLITIKGFLGILNNDIKEQKEDLIQKDMSRISNAADKMQNLLEDLLELSRIGRMINPSSKFSMNDVLKDVVELLNGVIANKNIKIIIQNNMPTVFGDRQRIYEVMQNLIENAIKFIGKTENPTIEIGYNNNKFFVKDNGIGIDNKYLTKIFGLFDKLDKNSEGTGIGLALVKRIIELHRGTVWVESEGFNKGATFYFTLP